MSKEYLSEIGELFKELSSPPPQNFDWIDAVLELRAKMAKLTELMAKLALDCTNK